MAQQLDALDVAPEAGRPPELKKRTHDLAAGAPGGTGVPADHPAPPPAAGRPGDAAGERRRRALAARGRQPGRQRHRTADGGEVNIKLEAHDTDVIPTVRDRGIGIPGGTRPHLDASSAAPTSRAASRAPARSRRREADRRAARRGDHGQEPGRQGQHLYRALPRGDGAGQGPGRVKSGDENPSRRGRLEAVARCR